MGGSQMQGQSRLHGKILSQNKNKKQNMKPGDVAQCQSICLASPALQRKKEKSQKKLKDSSQKVYFLTIWH
jgi:hypothetical protein